MVKISWCELVFVFLVKMMVVSRSAARKSYRKVHRVAFNFYLYFGPQTVFKLNQTY